LLSLTKTTLPGRDGRAELTSWVNYRLLLIIIIIIYYY